MDKKEKLISEIEEYIKKNIGENVLGKREPAEDEDLANTVNLNNGNNSGMFGESVKKVKEN